MAQLTEESKVIINLSHQEAQKRLSELKKEAIKLKKALDDAAMGSPERKRLRQDLAEVEKQAKAIRKELRQKIDVIIDGKVANAAMRDLRKAAGELRTQWEQSGNGLEKAKLAEKIRKINTEIAKQNESLRATQTFWQKYGQEIKSTFIGNLGANMATVGLQKLSGYFVDSFNHARELSDQIAAMEKTLNVSTQEARYLNSEFSKLDTRTSLKDLRAIAIVGGQFGVAKKDILGFVEAVDKTNMALSDEFTGGAQQVAEVMAKLRNIFLDIKSDDIGWDIQVISNAINELGAKGMATGPVVADFANRIGGVTIPLGFASTHVLGLSATLQELNVNVERGGTAVVRIVQKMLTNVDEFAKVAGMQTKDFSKLLNEDLFGAFKAVIAGSKELGINSTTLAGIIKDLDVDGAGASEVFAKLGQNMGMLDEKVALVNQTLTNNASITAEAGKFSENLAGKTEKLSKDFTKLMTNPALSNVFVFIIDGARGAVNAFNELMAILGGFDSYFNHQANKALAYVQEADKQRKALENQRVAELKQHLSTMSLEQLNAHKLNLVQTRNYLFEEAKIANQMGNQALANENIRLINLNKAEELMANKLIEQKQKTAQAQLQTQKELSAKEAEERKKAHDKELSELAKKAKEAARIAKEQHEAFTKEMYLQIDSQRWANDELSKLEDELNTTSLEKELEMLEKSRQNWDDFYKELEEYEKNATKQRIQSFSNYANEFISVMGFMDNYLTNQENAQLRRDKQNNEQQKKALDKRLKEGLISQEDYNTQIIALNRQMEESENAIANAQASRQHQLALFEATIKTILAWLEAYIDPTKIPGAIAASTQLALLGATEVPQFARGSKYTPEGFALVGEEGPELIKMPKGASIYPAWQTASIFNMGNAPVADLGFMGSTGANNTNQTNSKPQFNNTSSTVVVQRDPELNQILKDLLDKGVQGVWDFDRYDRGKKRYNDAKSRRLF